MESKFLFVSLTCCKEKFCFFSKVYKTFSIVLFLVEQVPAKKLGCMLKKFTHLKDLSPACKRYQKRSLLQYFICSGTIYCSLGKNDVRNKQHIPDPMDAIKDLLPEK